MTSFPPFISEETIYVNTYPLEAGSNGNEVVGQALRAHRQARAGNRSDQRDRPRNVQGPRRRRRRRRRRGPRRGGTRVCEVGSGIGGA